MGILEKFKLDGKKALVTGSGRGIGRGLAYALAEAGADVAICDVLLENAEKTAKEIHEATGRETIALKVDICDAGSVKNMVDSVVKAFGRLDIAVNNAGISIPIKSLTDVTPEEWDKQMQVNVYGTWHCIQEEARVMIPQKKGKIINTGSICGHIIWPTPQLPYSASKAAVIHMSRAAAAELIKHGINVNIISPGVTKVADLFPEVVETFFKTAPIDRTGVPADHQGAVVYLASELSNFMVGQEIILDGGYTIM